MRTTYPASVIPLLLFIIVAIFFSRFSLATGNGIHAIIEKVRAVSYDCPDASLLSELDATLAKASLTNQQRFALSTARSHFLICSGKHEEAQKTLLENIDQPYIDKTSYAFASAIYQIGFIYDTKENPARCQFYEQAKSLSSPVKHSDIFTSASLAIITYCSETDSTAERLGKMFNVLERYSDEGSPGELAHIRNSIGLVYGSLGQHALAAEQYIKAHELGLQVYKGSNKVSILISAIVSLASSGQTDEAYKRIIELGQLNQEIGNSYTNFLYQYSLQLYYRKQKDYNRLAYYLPQFKEALSAVSNSYYQSLYEWHATELCLFKNDIPCVENYLNSMRENDSIIPPKFRKNLDYLSFHLSMFILLDDLEGAKPALASYTKLVNDKQKANQSSAKILGAANLYNKIYDLEFEIERTERLRKNTLFAATALVLLLIAGLGFYLHKRHLAAKAIDPATQLLNAQTSISRINKLDTPEDGRAIAIAIFDLSNFRELNRKIGSTKSDYVLREIAKTLQHVVRGSDILGRFGPEQFILCLHNIDEVSARTFLERVQTALDNTFEEELSTGDIKVQSNMSIFITSEKLSNLSDILDDMIMSFNISNR
ncbi:GGDEF domain-containing protein [Alteromonas sp. A081]|uniref:GGDEF domain-containing protein n=1 Tax=Alteromonas sp. A081 TaxID=3410269 RepID=UPI003B983379